MMLLRRYAARYLLPEARASLVVEDDAIGLHSKINDARSRPIIARRYLATRTNMTAVSTVAGAGAGGVVRGEEGGRGRGGGGGGAGGESRGDGGATVSASSSETAPTPPAACSSPRYVLPPPSWSLADLKLVQRASDSDDTVHEGTAGSVLSREEVTLIYYCNNVDQFASLPTINTRYQVSLDDDRARQLILFMASYGWYSSFVVITVNWGSK